MITIELKELNMHAYHGFYQGEEVDGSPYSVTLSVQYEENESADFAAISETVDYAALFQIVYQRMMVPSPLLEKVAISIIRQVKHAFPVSRTICISIYKLKPPIPLLDGAVGVTICKSFDE